MILNDKNKFIQTFFLSTFFILESSELHFGLVLSKTHYLVIYGDILVNFSKNFEYKIDHISKKLRT